MKNQVSVVIPYYNAAETLGRALISIQEQTLAVDEIIIVNDGSDLEQLKTIILPFQDSLPITLVDLGGNRGASYARNTGIANATGEFIAFLDSDDVWHKEKNKIQYDFMRSSGAYMSCHGYVFNLNKDKMTGENSGGAKKLNFIDFVWRNHIFTPSVMVKRSNFIDFDSRLSRAEDLKCFLSNFSNGEVFRLPDMLAGGYKKGVGESGLSGSIELMHKEYLRAWRMLYQEKKVNFFVFAMAILIEKAKYPIRLARS
jgi:glycosyltransferase involved in cell wall biosynthesis